MPRRKSREDEEEEEEAEQPEPERERERGSSSARSAGRKRVKAPTSSSGSGAATTTTTTTTTTQEASSYTDAHRVALQMLLTRRAVRETEFVEILKAAHQAHVSPTTPPPSVGDAVAAMNRRLAPLNFQVRRRVMAELQGAPPMWCVVNTRKDEAAKAFTRLDDSQLGVFRVAVELAVQSADGFFQLSELVREYKERKGVGKSASDVQALLETLATQQWLHAGQKRNFFTLGPRTFLELGDLLRELGAHQCEILKSSVVRTATYRAWLKDQGGKPLPEPAEAASSSLAATAAATTTTTSSSSTDEAGPQGETSS